MNQHPFRYRHLVWALLCCVVVLPHAAAAQQGCVRFEGLDHCPVGNAELQLAPDGSHLLVTGLGPQGDDGVSSEFEAATHWRARMSMEGGNQAIFRALADGFLTSSTMLEGQSDGFSLRTTFTGSAGPHTYQAVVIQDGSVVAVFDGLDESSSLDLQPVSMTKSAEAPGGRPDWFLERLEFGRDIGCIWLLDLSDWTVVTAPSGQQAVGNTVQLIEDVAGGGSYPYAYFNAIVTQADGSSLVITEEEVFAP